ncbi:unnamed protein product, partial [Meganyctiphanes norvegica]
IVYWGGPYRKCWSEEQCDHLESEIGGTLKDCKSLCVGNLNCTNINYTPSRKDVESDCVLIHCGTPIPRPRSRDPPCKGYILIGDPTMKKCRKKGGNCLNKDLGCPGGKVLKPGKKYCEDSKFFQCCVQ